MWARDLSGIRFTGERENLKIVIYIFCPYRTALVFMHLKSDL